MLSSPSPNSFQVQSPSKNGNVVYVISQDLEPRSAALSNAPPRRIRAHGSEFSQTFQAQVSQLGKSYNSWQTAEFKPGRSDTDRVCTSAPALGVAEYLP